MKKILLFVLLSSNLFASDGSLDTSFGVGGFVTGPASPLGVGAAVQADGKIVATGANSGNESIIVRYLPNGSLDTSFGGTGSITTPTNIFLNDILIQPDGKILGVGTNGTGILIRYNSDGSLDTTFGTNGTVINAGVSNIAAVILQPDSKIVVVGRTAGAGGLWRVFRYTPSGVLETTFTSGPISSTPEDLIMQADGKIVVVGSLISVPHVIRYNNNGTQDVIFATPAGVTLGNFRSVAITSGGKIIAAGMNLVTGTFLITRYETNGTLDATFGTGGSTFAPAAGGMAFKGLVLQANEKPVLVGVNTAGDMFQVARYTQNGILDTSFAGTGVVTGPSGIGNAAAIQKNGYTIGIGNDTGNTNLILARYINSPALVETTINTPTTPLIAGGSITLTGTAQNPSNVYIFINGVLAGGVVTDPAGSNTWSFTTTLPNATSFVFEAVSIYKNHKLNISSGLITPSIMNLLNFTGRLVCNTFLNRTEQIIFASWQSDPTAVLYKIYKKDKVICTIKPNGSSTLSSTICLQRCDQVSDFSISFVNAADVESSRSVLVLS